MDIFLISVPYRYDEHMSGLGKGPPALIGAGLERSVERSGHNLVKIVESELLESDREPSRTAVNIGKLGSATAALVAEAAKQDARMLVLTGDDTASIGIVAGLQQAYGAGARIGVVWLDAHGDFNTPDTSYSGILAGMSLAILAGLAGPNWRAAAKLAAPVSTDRIIIAGIRELDEKEQALLDATDVQCISTKSLRTNVAALENALSRLADRVDMILLHVDVDVLDPELVPSSSTPNPGGLDISATARAMHAVLATDRVRSISVCGVNPGGGARGKKTVRSVMDLIDQVLPAWH